MFSEDTFSGVHQEVIRNAFCAGSSLFVENFTEFAHFMAEIVFTQVFSGWALAWLFNLKADSIFLKRVSWDASLTYSSGIVLIAKIADSYAFSEIIGHKSDRANNLDAL